MPASSSWVASFRSTAAQSGISKATFDRAFRDVTDPDPEVLEKARTQAEFKAPAWDYFDNRVQEQSIANGRAMAQEVEALARPHREAVRRRPLHPARHLVDGIELRRYFQGQENNAQRRALAGDPCLCRQEARQIRAHAADRGAEDPADRRHRREPPDRLMGRRDGPHAVHPDQLPGLCRRHRRRRPARHLELRSRRAGVVGQSAAQERLAGRQDLGLRGLAARTARNFPAARCRCPNGRPSA